MRINTVCTLLCVGQLYCLFLGLSGAFSQVNSDLSKQLENQSLPTPFLNSMLVYALMFAVYLPGAKQDKFRCLYLLNSLTDVGGQVFSIIAYQNTLISNVAILSGCGALAAAFLSVVLFKVKYSFVHYISFLLCLIGISLKFFTDSGSNQSTTTDSFFGDIMGVIASVLYGTSSFISQTLLRQGASNTAVNFRIGFFGFAFVSLLFFGFKQYTVLLQRPVMASSYFLYLGYGVAGLLNYIFSIISIQLGGATAYNLIGLSKMAYTMLFDFFFFHSSFKFTDIIAYLFVITGMVLFYSNKPTKREESDLNEPLLKSILEDSLDA